MTHDIEEVQIRGYLAALEARLAHLPADQSEEILFSVREHIAQAMERGGQSTGEVLACLGSPDEIAGGMAEAPVRGPVQQLPPPAPAQRYQSSTLWVVASCILLPFGGYLAGIGWLFGVAGLWMGTRWKTWEKIVGTVLLPLGVLGAQILAFLPIWGPLIITSTQDSSGNALQGPLIPGLSLGGTIALTCLPAAVAIYLLIIGLRRGPTQR